MNNLKIKEPVTVKGTIYLIAFAFMVSSIIFIATYGAGQIGYAIRIGGTGIIFIIVLAILLNKTHHPTERTDSLAISGIDKEVVEQDATTNLKYRKFQHFDSYPRYFDLHQILENKPNKNISVIGMAGSGKTQLTYKIISEMKEYKKVIFQYKNSDRYKELGYPTLKIRQISPDVFEDKEAFSMAWITAFSIENRGITAGQILPLVRNAVNVSRNWKEFKEEIERQGKKERGTITGAALTDIKLKLDTVYSERQFTVPLPDEIVVDFSGIPKEKFVFMAEWLLRLLYKEIREGKREGTMIFVDEAHLFTNTTNTIIPELSAIIRSRGAFLFSTQRASTIAGDIKGNAGTQFCFKQTEEDDLRVINAISPLLGFSIKELKMYEFLDLAQNNINDVAFQTKLCNPKPQFYPEKEWTPEVSDEEKAMDYTTEAIKALDKARNVQSIAKKISQNYNLDRDRLKMNIIPILKRMVSSGELNVIEVENAKIVKDRIQSINEKIYFKPNTEQLHEYLVKSVGDILYLKGIKFKIEEQGKSVPDITGRDFVAEIETGLKKRRDDLDGRVEKAKSEGKVVFIITPNQEIKKLYKGGMTISEFSAWLDEAENYGIKEEGKEEVQNE